MAVYINPALVVVAGVALPEPSSYEANTATLVDSARNAAGIMIGDVIRDDIAKVSMKWNYLEADIWAQINSLFKTSAGGHFTNSVTFFDQASGANQTRQMYISDRSAGMWRRDPETHVVLGWTNCSLDLIEV